MPLRRWRPALLAGALAAPLACTAQPASTAPPRAPLALAHVTVVDVRAGRLLPDRTVVVDAGRIVAVASADSVRLPAGARVVEARGAFLIPGLWDMHVHTPPPDGGRMLPVYVAHGVTGVRDMGTDLAPLRRWQADVAAGAAVGPRIVAAGPILDGPLGVPMPAEHRRWRIEVTDTARARHLVDSLAALGADFVKVHERLAGPVYRAIVAQAGRRGLAVAGHVPTAVGAAAVAAAGQRSVEHLVNVPFACTPAEADTLRPRSRLEELLGRCATEDQGALLRGFVEHGTWHDPTLVVQRRIALGAGTAADDPGTRHVPASVVETLRAVGPFDLPPLPPEQRARLGRLFEQRLRQVGALHRAGVRLLVGTDAPGVAPGWSVHEELALLVRAGLSPVEALRAATLHPALYLDAADSLGTVEPGRVADLVLLDADPLADVRNTRRIRAVVADGRYLDRAALDRLLDEAALGSRHSALGKSVQ